VIKENKHDNPRNSQEREYNANWDKDPTLARCDVLGSLSNVL
jgi:hypothetical protein